MTPNHRAVQWQGPLRPRRVLVLLLPEVHLQDMAGPVQVLSEAGALGGAYEIAYCSELSRVRSAQGLVLSDLAPLPVSRQDDLVLVPGVRATSLDRLDHLPRRWLREAHEVGARLASVCSGAFALARAGLLDGRRCTTHWKLVARLRAEYPEAQVLENRLFVEDQGVITSAGVASGIDMALALVERDHGPIVVSRVAREMVVYLRRNGDHEQRSVYLDYRTHLHPGVHRVQDWLVAHPEKKPVLAQLAHLAALSPRHFARVFRQATGVTAKQFATKIKVNVARDLLADPQRSLQSIAESCGFEDARQLRRIWKHSFGVSIGAFRTSQKLQDNI